jgi:hypothetical protein
VTDLHPDEVHLLRTLAKVVRRQAASRHRDDPRLTPGAGS